MELKNNNVIVLSVNNEGISQFDNLKIMMVLGNVIKKSIRKSDVVNMTDANEFEVVVPSCTSELASKIGERIVANFGKTELADVASTIQYSMKSLAYSA